MAYRSHVRRQTDKRVFKHTAENSKKINLMPKVSRGGIRL